jgi:hypothetical protein
MPQVTAVDGQFGTHNVNLAGWERCCLPIVE